MGGAEGFKCIDCVSCSFNENDVMGLCRYNSPTIDGFPAVHLKQDWCEKCIPKEDSRNRLNVA